MAEYVLDTPTVRAFVETVRRTIEDAAGPQAACDAIRLGYEGEVEQIADLYLDGKKDEAADKVPRELIEELSLIGPKDQVRDDLDKWRESIVTTLLISGDAATLRDAAELVLEG